VAIEKQSANDAHGAPDAAMPMSSKGAARRRFAKTGVGVGGVLLTLQSQAATCVGVPISASGYQSYKDSNCVLNSHTTKHVGTAGGRPASYWTSCDARNWPASPNTSYSATCANYPFWRLFNPTSRATYQTGTWPKTDMTLVDVLNGKASDGGIGKACVAAWLNSKTNLTTYLPTATVISIFKGCDTGIGYAPATSTSGKKWTKTECLTYLGGTMSAS
jgi:hypothetical protein